MSYPKIMHPSLCSIPAQPHRVRVSRQPIHNRKADGARLRYLQPQIIVHTGHGVIMLMNNKVMTMVMLISLVKIYQIKI